jgi:hypothetical protein
LRKRRTNCGRPTWLDIAARQHVEIIRDRNCVIRLLGSPCFAGIVAGPAGDAVTDEIRRRPQTRFL